MGNGEWGMGMGMGMGMGNGDGNGEWGWEWGMGMGMGDGGWEWEWEWGMGMGMRFLGARGATVAEALGRGWQARASGAGTSPAGDWARRGTAMNGFGLGLLLW
jgi:hypothetical protein